MLTKRTNILFDEQLWEHLIELAREQKVSVGELVRTAVKEYYDLTQDTKQRIQNACHSIEAKRKHQKGTLDYKALVNYGRKI